MVGWEISLVGELALKSIETDRWCSEPCLLSDYMRMERKRENSDMSAATDCIRRQDCATLD